MLSLTLLFVYPPIQSDKDSKEDIGKVFNLFDDDKSGKISLRNLKRVARELGETMSDAELMEMIERADTDEDGEINPDEFYAIMYVLTRCPVLCHLHLCGQVTSQYQLNFGLIVLSPNDRDPRRVCNN